MENNMSDYLFISESRKRSRYSIGGEFFSAKDALKKFPQLIGILQPKGKIKQKSLQDKFRHWFAKGRLKKEVFQLEPPQFKETNSALEKTFREYLCNDPILNNYDVPSLFELLDKNIKKTFRENLNTKVYLSVRALMRKISDEKEATHTFYSGEFEILQGTDLDEVIFKMRETISERLSKMELAVGSGWTLLKILSIKLHFANFKPLRGSSFVELPSWIKNKKAVINILNKTDSECFKWCVTRALHPIGKNPERLSKKLREQSIIFDWTGVNFPTTFEDISRFEKNNNVSVKVLGCDDNEIIYLRNGNGRYKLAVTLLLFEGHYCVVKNMSRLTSRQLVDNKVYFCDYCSFTHREKLAVLKHQESCTGEVLEPERIMPKKGSTVSFKNFERSVEQPFVIYADSESRLRSADEKKGKSTTQFQEHIPIGYAYQLVSRIDESDNKLVQYTATTEDEDVALHFLKSLEGTTRELHEKYGESKPMEITPEEQAQFDDATKCWVCGGNFDLCEDRKVRDHCHFTGKYRGAAHNKCNLRLTRSKRIPVLFYNFTNYDNHLLVK